MTETDTPMGASTAEILEEVLRERKFQDNKWGPIDVNPHDKGTWLILMEDELAEARRALVKGGEGRNSFRAEIIQTIAVGFALLEQHGTSEGVNGNR